MRPLKAITLLIILFIASSAGLGFPRRINVEEIGPGTIARNLPPVTSDEVQPSQRLTYHGIPRRSAGAPSESPESLTSIASASGEVFLGRDIANQTNGGEEMETAPRNRRAFRIPGFRIPIRPRPQLPKSPGGISPASVPKAGSSPASPPKRGFTPESPGPGRPQSPSGGGPKSDKGAPVSADGKPPSRKEGSKGSFPDLDDVLSIGSDLADFFAGGKDSENPKDCENPKGEGNTRKSPLTTTTERSSPKRSGPPKGPGNFHPQGHVYPKGPGHFHHERHFHPGGHFHPEGPGEFHRGGPVRFPDDAWHGR